MDKIRRFHFLLLMLLVFVLSGCATYAISSSLRSVAKKDLTFNQVRDNASSYVGSIVIWGGILLDSVNTPDGTELIILQTPFQNGEVPNARGYSQGRFIAKTKDFLDPAIFTKGRKITVAGEITGVEERQLGKLNYKYPVIMIKELHLWQRVYYTYCPDYWDGWYGWPTYRRECYPQSYWQ